MNKKTLFLISHIFLISLMIGIYLYGENTMPGNNVTYTVDQEYSEMIDNRLIIQRTLGGLLLVTFIVCIYSVVKYVELYKWLYLLLVFELFLFGCFVLIFIYSFMFI